MMKIRSFDYRLLNRYVLLWLAVFLPATVVEVRATAISPKPGRLAAGVSQIEISGTVRDESGQELPGVNVLVRGTQTGTITDASGKYLIRVPDEDAVLVFSFVGYLSREIQVSKQKVLDVTLAPDQKNLDEVVVIGYGTQKKTSLTAAVSTLKGDEVREAPVTNITNAIGGRVAGVILKQGSGEPGRDGSNIFIRGISSTGSTQPLVIIDGIPRDFSQFSQLDPNTVDSYTILKDAAAVAPYGVAGANGVILVTTKRGKTGEPVLSYNGYIGIQNPTVLPKYVTNYDYARLRNEAAANDGLPRPYSDHALQKYKDGSDPDAFPSTYVWDYLVNKNAVLTTHNVEVSGGTERISYYGSFGYQLQEGMWKTTSNNRFNLNMNLDAKVTRTTRLSLGMIGRVQKFLYPPSDYPGNGTGRIFELAGFATPQYGPFEFSNGMFGNHVASGIFGTGYYRFNTTNINTQLTLTQELPFVQGLSFKGTVAFDPTFTDDKTWRTPMHVATIDTTRKPYVISDGIFNDPKASLGQSYSKAQQLTYQAGLYYNRAFGKNNLNIIGVFEAKNNYGASFGTSRRNYDLLVDEINMGSSNPQDWGSNGSSWEAKQLGLVYRAAYDFDGKYMLEASGRYDGSYYFAPGKRFGFFPAFSAGWRLSEEPFLKNVRGLSNLKLRASYGEVGALAGSPFQYMGTYNVIGGNHVLGGNPVMGISERIEPNLNITWERARKTDVGVEVGLWNGLLNAEIDYFYEKRSNMLVSPNEVVPLEYGIGLSQQNAGIMSNRGIEFTVGSRYQVAKDLSVSLSGNFTYARNKLEQVFETSATYDNPNRRRTGRPLGTQFGYQALGFFQQSDFNGDGALNEGIAIQPWGKVSPGDIRYQDMNHDGKIDENDLTVIGDPSAAPRIIYGLSPSVKYKNISLDLLFQGAARVNYYYHASSIMPFWNGMQAYTFNFDYWKPENPNAAYPRLTGSPLANNMQTSSFWMGNAAYLRLKSINVSYTLPAGILGRVGLEAAKVYVSGQNLFTWTKMLYDPELGGNTSYAPSSAWTYPQQKVVSVGLNLTF